MYSWVDHANRVHEWICGCDARGRGLRVPDNDRVMHANAIYLGINGPVRPGEDVDAAEHDRPEDGKPE